MPGPRRFLPRLLLGWLVFAQGACTSYIIRTAPGPAHEIPADFFGVAPGPVAPETFRRNGWALADSHEGVQTYVRGAGPNSEVSEAEAVLTQLEGGQLRVDCVRLRFGQTRLATYRTLLGSLVEKHGPPQVSDERVSFPEFVLDPKSERPRPPRVVVHRWRGPRFDMVLVGGLEVPENLASSMDYQLLFLPPQHGVASAVP
jgi:hypothetical protein